MKTLLSLVFFAFVSSLVGCSTMDGYFRKTSDARPSKKFTNVDFYMAGLPKKNHKEVGFITTQGATYRDAFDRVQRLAVEHNCEAVANMHEVTEGSGQMSVTRMSASCYVYRK
jgi:hypothetical protein